MIKFHMKLFIKYLLNKYVCVIKIKETSFTGLLSRSLIILCIEQCGLSLDWHIFNINTLSIFMLHYADMINYRLILQDNVIQVRTVLNFSHVNFGIRLISCTQLNSSVKILFISFISWATSVTYCRALGQITLKFSTIVFYQQ